jgi:hypothetical protein
MRWTGFIARIGMRRRIRRRMDMGFWCESQKEKDRYEELNVDGRIILKFTLEK